VRRPVAFRETMPFVLDRNDTFRTHMLISVIDQQRIAQAQPTRVAQAFRINLGKPAAEAECRSLRRRVRCIELRTARQRRRSETVKNLLLQRRLAWESLRIKTPVLKIIVIPVEKAGQVWLMFGPKIQVPNPFAAGVPLQTPPIVTRV